MKITVVGLGYVGTSSAILLAQHNEVVAVDITVAKVNSINQKISPIGDKDAQTYLNNKPLNLIATTDLQSAVSKSDFVIVSTPTNYNEQTNYFDTASVEKVITQTLKYEPQTCIVIKSTIPIGFVEAIRKKTGSKNIFFSPEFLREGQALYDNLNPSRIIVGDSTLEAKKFAGLLTKAADKKDIDIKFMGPNEAEAVKLFANTYLAMRVAFFNELDTYAWENDMSTEQIIDGVSLDPRIGQSYNNPSFGYGGYCLPKDTKQLLANYGQTPQRLMQSIVDSNETRKAFITKKILQKNPTVVGIYRLAMKTGSDNFRQSAIHDIIAELKQNGKEVTIYEPELDQDHFMDCRIIRDLNEFLKKSDVIIANRISRELVGLEDKVISRDVYNRD